MPSDTDLILERVLDAPLDLVWKAYTDPDHMKQWWAPRPYQTPKVDIDWRPGGIFHFVMTGPDDFREDSSSCVLEYVPQERIAWTSALGPGFRPNDLSQKDGCEAFAFTAVVTFGDAGNGKTAYKAVALHKNSVDRDTHEKMGFEEGWGTCAAQLEEVARKLA